MVTRILCVAEKPAIAKKAAEYLSGGRFATKSVRGNKYVKNYEFDFSFNNTWGHSSVVMTSVIGHLKNYDFESQYKNWNSSSPASLFEAPIQQLVDKEKQPIADNIKSQARRSQALFIWTDCDREGEAIGAEIRQEARKGNPRIETKRAKFSNTERAHVIRAAHNPILLDDNAATAVDARQELDLRIGAAFTRFLTLQLRTVGGQVDSKRMISFGSCQFPTLGFVVDRYFRVKNFVPETFWSIKITHTKDNITVNFLWDRNHLFDRAATTVLFELCLNSGHAIVKKVNRKPTSKWRPLPLTTVDLQMMGSKYLRMDSSRVMKVAEDLYTKGFISYPRTETDKFDKAIDLKRLIDRQCQGNNWGDYARSLMNGGFRQPRAGRHDDKAHPPIHPVNYAASSVLSADEGKVYDFIVRRFLACCSEDAKGESTDIELQYGPESFHTRGLLVLERNYLNIYVYDKWESSQKLPHFTVGEIFEPREALMSHGKTAAPTLLTEPELIGLMDANGIGTDATMAEHISKILDREYVTKRSRGRGGANSPQEFVPTWMGIALVKGFDNVVAVLPNCPNLSKPFLRKDLEDRLKQICEGRTPRSEVVQQDVNLYREVFAYSSQRVDLLKATCQRYMAQAV